MSTLAHALEITLSVIRFPDPWMSSNQQICHNFTKTNEYHLIFLVNVTKKVISLTSPL